MSLVTLATLLDGIADAGDGNISENAAVISASELSVDHTALILKECLELGWSAPVVDREDNLWELATVSSVFAPFRITIYKPTTTGTLRLLTNNGFKRWLNEGPTQPKVHLARLGTAFSSQFTRFAPWDDEVEFLSTPETKSPRSLVREYGDQRVVPKDIRPWILTSSAPRLADPAFAAWADAASRNLLYTLPDEIDVETGELRFKGPPRLSLLPPSATNRVLEVLGWDGFNALQAAASWTFEVDRESEMRHLLLAAGIAQSGSGHSDAVGCVRQNLLSALDGAKIAYQMSLSDLSRDTLRALGDLRKAVTEDTAKVTEITRQTVTAVASAIVIGIGLIAAKVTTNVNGLVLVAIMGVSTAYVGIVVGAGLRFMWLQHQLRKDWQPRLYRFLPPDDYAKMVANPINSAETTAYWSGGIGFLAVLALLAAVSFVDRLPSSTKPNLGADKSSESTMKTNHEQSGPIKLHINP